MQPIEYLRELVDAGPCGMAPDEWERAKPAIRALLEERDGLAAEIRIKDKLLASAADDCGEIVRLMEQNDTLRRHVEDHRSAVSRVVALLEDFESGNRARGYSRTARALVAVIRHVKDLNLPVEERALRPKCGQAKTSGGES